MSNLEETFDATDPKSIRSMMEAMPAMMERCCATMSADEMGSMMRDVMEGMMESCFSMMDAQQAEEMLRMCHEMLEGMEAKHQSAEAEEKAANTIGGEE